VGELPVRKVAIFIIVLLALFTIINASTGEERSPNEKAAVESIKALE
jgi:hypothetical protein